ncbi:MAG: alpha/beta hydrolase [Hyphomonadaceae bacterium]|nr:alpha/beta hydrolase [Hyphomonadaceae bacterium]
MLYSGTIDRGDGVRLAYQSRTGEGPCFVWLCGFMSDMNGAKALALDDWAATEGRPFLRFDYSGCGQSEGKFEDGTISRWRDDAMAVLDHIRPGRIVLVGSSMGGWIALLLAAIRKDIEALLLVAPAPDFTTDLLWPRLPAEAKRAIEATGAWRAPSQYVETGALYTRQLIEDGAKHRVLDKPIVFPGPIHILHGQQDPDVPWRRSLDLADRIAHDDVVLTLLKDGDHRLSRPRDLLRLCRMAATLAEQLP